MNLQSCNNKPNNQAGMTLVELMVAMVISLLLIAGTITIFISNKQAYRLNEASSRVQENGRFALDFIRRDVRMAGYLGCVRPSAAAKLRNNIKLDQINSQVKEAIDGYDGTESLKGYDFDGALHSDLTDIGLATGTTTGDVISVADGSSDIIVIKRAESCFGGKIAPGEPTNNANFKITDNSVCKYNQNEILLVSNCQGGDIFGVTNVPNDNPGVTATLTTGSVNIDNKVSRKYGTESEIYRLQTIVYYIGQGASGSPALFKRSIDAGAFTNVELIEDVEDMSIVYGVDTDDDGSADYYDIADDVQAANDWPQVISARIQVDVQSGAQNVVQSTAAGADRRLRHTFTETIRIRNSL